MNSYKQSLYIGTIRVIANIAMIGFLFLSMRQASIGSLPTEAGFCLWFFGLTLPLWTGIFYLTRFIRKRFPAEHESFVDLPHLGRQLVRWHVRQTLSPDAFPLSSQRLGRTVRHVSPF
ncbi:MAG: hypothetical protein LBB60_04545 [Desulfovibrio sp.]|jgi:hypothetical protein|nr:hypothetical protein [Desulfovibrio sp.]